MILTTLNHLNRDNIKNHNPYQSQPKYVHLFVCFDTTSIASFAAANLQCVNYFVKSNYHQIFGLPHCSLIHLLR